MYQTRWSSGEEAYLRAAWGVFDAETIAKVLTSRGQRRSKHGVQSKAINLGLCEPKVVWTEGKKEKLRREYPSASYESLESEFGCTRIALQSMASRLGIKRNKDCIDHAGGAKSRTDGDEKPRRGLAAEQPFGSLLKSRSYEPTPREVGEMARIKWLIRVENGHVPTGDLR